MAMTINTNVMSLNAQRHLSTTNSSLATSMQRLSSGLRVNSAKDDAAGLAIAERMNSQVRGANVAIRNANDAISMFQTAEGALGRVQENLQRMRELAVQAANGTLSTEDVSKLQSEVNQLSAETQRIVDNSKFNGVNLFDGSALDSVSFQIGADSSDTITVEGTSFNLTDTGDVPLLAYGDGTDPTPDGATPTVDLADAAAAIDDLTADIDTISNVRATAGSLQSRFEAVVQQLQVYSENTSAARGRIMDADFAQETANLSRSQILQQAGSAMVAQANQAPQQVLALLRNF